jgi:hypothetical protein
MCRLSVSYPMKMSLNSQKMAKSWQLGRTSEQLNTKTMAFLISRRDLL